MSWCNVGLSESIRNRVYYYRRRVPARFRALEEKDEIVITLNTDALEVAKAKAANINSKIEQRWNALRASDAGDAEKCWKAANEIARVLRLFVYRC